MSENDNSTHDSERREHLVYDGICPVCGEEFIDGYGQLEEGESYDARICVDEIDGEGEGKILVHLEESKDDELLPYVEEDDESAATESTDTQQEDQR